MSSAADNVLTLLNSVQLPLVPGGIVLAVIRQDQNRELLRYWVSRGRR